MEENKELNEKKELVRKLKSVSQFLKGDDWKVVRDILKDARTGFVRGILATLEVDEKLYTEADKKKIEVMSINRILNLANIIDSKLEGEEIQLKDLLKTEEEELEIGDEDEIFNTTVDA